MYKIITVILVFAIMAFAQTTEYPHVQDNGGGYIETPGYRSYASIGQPVIGECTDGSHINQAGYLTSLSVYLEVLEKPGPKPQKYAITSVYPNPFNSSCAIEFEISEMCDVAVELFDMQGRKVANLANEVDMKAGSYRLRWNAGDLTSGVYFIRLNAGGRNITNRVVLMK